MFTRTENDRLMMGLDKIIQEYAKANGVNIQRAGSRYGEDINTKLTFTKNVTTADGTFPATKESRDFKKENWQHNIPQEALFESINTKDGLLIIMGLSTRRPKFPISYTMNGKNMKSSISYIENLLKNSDSQYGI